MTSFSFTVEQIKSAPPEVRHWIENEIASAFRSLMTAAPAPQHAPELAACTPQEALRVFELVRHDFAAAQVFLELGREPTIAGAAALHALAVGEIKRRLRIGDERLTGCFTLINECFLRVRNDPDATLFGFDEANHVYIHETTHRSIRQLWEELLRISAAGETHPFGFAPPVVGPSEKIAAH